MICCIYWWLLLDNGGITLNLEILKVGGIWREMKTLALLQVEKKRKKRDHGEQYLNQTPRNSGY